MTQKNMKIKLQKLIKPYLDDLFFPDGLFGGEVYYIKENGFYGPHSIPDYVVPVFFSSEALVNFKQKLTSCNQEVDSISDDEIENITQGVDLTFGEGWELAPEDFVEMVRSGCEADTYYLKDSSIGIDDYEEFFSFLEDGLLGNYHLTEWSDLELEDIEHWCEILSEASNPI